MTLWSKACIMTKFIEHITGGGIRAYTFFRDHRVGEDRCSAASWKMGLNGRYELKQIVQKILIRFEAFQNRYLDLTMNILNFIFFVDSLLWPTMLNCLTIISKDIPANE